MNDDMFFMDDPSNDWNASEDNTIEDPFVNQSLDSWESDLDSQDDVLVTSCGSDVSYTGIGDDISFGNHWDDNTVKFLDDCRKCGVDLPMSVTHSTSYSGMEVDRAYEGGLTSIDKSIIRDTLESQHSDGSLSDDDYKRLSDKLSSC